MSKPGIDFTVSVNTGLGEDPQYLHVPYDRRGHAGALMAAYLDFVMRDQARAGGLSLRDAATKPLCPGCAMSVIVNMIRDLCRVNGWSLEYMRDHLNPALDQLIERGVTDADRSVLEAIERDRLSRDRPPELPFPEPPEGQDEGIERGGDPHERAGD